jgi:hypothetical protein
MADWESWPIAGSTAQGGSTAEPDWTSWPVVGHAEPPSLPDQPEPPAPSLSAGHRAGVAATGINDALASMAGAPVDLMTGALNLGSRGINAAGAAVGHDPNLGQITNPAGGSETFRRLIGGTVGRTEPTDTLDTALYGAGAGAGSAVGGMGIGAGLQAAGKLPMLARALAAGSGTPGGVAANTGIGAAAGVGAAGGENLAGQLTDNPALRETGGIVGGLATGMLAAGTPVAALNSWRAGRAALKPLMPSGREDLAGRILNESATYGDPGPVQRPLGIEPTLGQASNDPGLLALERTVQQARPGITGDLAARQGDNNQRVLAGIDQLGTPGDPAALSQRLAQGLDQNRKAMRATERSAWEAIDPSNSVNVPTQPLKDNYAEFAAGLSTPRRRFLPTEYADLVNAYPETAPMREFMDLRSMLGNDIRTARGAGDYNRLNVLTGLDRALFKGMPEEGGAPLPAGADAAATLRYQNALGASRAYNQTFNRGPLGRIFASDAQGADRIPDSAVADHLFAPGRGQTERVRQFVAASNAHPDRAPKLMGTARDWFTSKMTTAAQSAAQDATGNQFVLGNKLRRFVQQNRPLIASEIFAPEQRALLDEIVDAATTVERTMRGGPKGGSDTAAKLAGGNYVQGLVGDWFKPAINAVAHGVGTIGGYMTGGPFGAAGGFVAARGVNNLAGKLYGDAGGKVMSLLAEALRDPEMARELMRKASSTPSFARPRTENFLATLPATAAAVMPEQQAGTPLDRAAAAVARLGPGEPVTRRLLMQAAGISSMDQMTALRNELIGRGLVASDGGRYSRALTINEPAALAPPAVAGVPAAPEPLRGGALSPAAVHPLRDSAYAAAKVLAPTLRGSTFDEIASDIEARPSPLHGALNPGGLVEQIASGQATHETMHLMQRARLIPADDWRVLTSKAEGWAAKFDVPTDLPAPIRREEGIARAFNAYAGGELKLPPGLRRIFGSVQKFSKQAAD